MPISYNIYIMKIYFKLKKTLLRPKYYNECAMFLQAIHWLLKIVFSRFRIISLTKKVSKISFNALLSAWSVVIWPKNAHCPVLSDPKSELFEDLVLLVAYLTMQSTMILQVKPASLSRSARKSVMSHSLVVSIGSA